MDNSTPNINRIVNINEQSAISIMVYLSIGIALIAIGTYVYYSTLQSRLCNNMTSLYGDMNGKIHSIDTSKDEYKHKFKDYYVKSAYNACSGGSYNNSYVSTCILKNLLKQGVRGLDFEIFSIENEPVVATTSNDSNEYCNKDTFNYVNFAEVMKIINNYAFDNSNSPNSEDPIILHLRIKSDNANMYQNCAKIFEQYSTRMMGKSTSYENGGKNFGNTLLEHMKGKIILIVDKKNNSFTEVPEFYEYVNMASNSVFMRALHYYDIKYTPDIDELIEANKVCMTIGMPDKGSDPDNPSAVVMRECGCQLLAMRYQLFDEYLQENNIFFDNHNSAFVLKPERLRQQDITIDAPPPQNPKLSFATRNVKSDFYNFEI